MKIRFPGPAMLALALIAAGGLFAQSPRDLRFGSWVSGTIGGGSEEWFSIRAVESGVMILETSGGTDTYLEAFDSARKLLGENDDGGTDGNARLEIVVNAGLSYLVKLRGYDGDVSGSYRFLASFEPLPPDERNTSRDRAVLLNPGKPADGFLREAGESRWYRLVIPPAGGQVTAYTEGSTDTILGIYDSRGALVAEGDDHGEDTNARASAVLSGGTAYVKVTGYEDTKGRYTLHAVIREPPKPDRYEPDNISAGAKEIAPGERQERTFTGAGDVDWARLRITAAGDYAIRAAAADALLDTYLELYDSDGVLLQEDDDSGGDFDALIERRLSPGTYYIRARTIDDDPLDDNRYTLSVTP